MNDITSQSSYGALSALTVLRGLLKNGLIAAYARAAAYPQDAALRARFCHLLFEAGAEDAFLTYAGDAALRDDNAFSRACAAGKTPSERLQRAFLTDLALLAGQICAGEGEDYSAGQLPAPLRSLTPKTLPRLFAYYRENGCGKFLGRTAFRYEGGALAPIFSPASVRLSDLKGYEREKAEVYDNFDNFLRGLPFSDMLLYGDRGTGKSSTVHAMVNEFAPRGLRLVEIRKEDILDLPRLKTQLAAVPLRFVIFIDDFSLAEDDARFSTLKASLQGSMEGQAENVMIVATSNRRHIVEENFDSRRNSVHENDSEQELLSLSDRFGITVLFSGTGKAEYLAIVRALACDLRIKTPPERLEALAERWALFKGGRSPRRAKQFIGYVAACEGKGKPAEF